MKVFAVTICVMLFSQHSFGQNSKSADFNRSHNYDTSRINYSIISSQQLGLDNLITSSQLHHFRYWPGFNCVIDITTSDYKSFAGVYKVFIYGTPEKLRKTKQAMPFVTEYCISNDTSKIICHLLDSLLTIPTEDSILGWNNVIVNDGYGALLEYATQTNYIMKEWNNPQARAETFPRAKEVFGITKRIMELFSAGQKWEQLINSLPDGNYSNGSVNISKHHFKTRSAYRRWKRQQLKQKKESD